MRIQIWAVAVLGGFFAVLGCGSEPLANSAQEPAVQAQAPADGNGTKQVNRYNFDTDPMACPNGKELILHVGGWVQIHTFSNSNRVELDIYHVVHTWRNSAGETFVDLEIGPDRYYIDKNTGHLILASTGKLSAFGIVGQLVTDLTTGEVIFVAGRAFPDHLALACEALT